jgi:type II secretory pathway component GspD/PulD (secretin)
MAVHLDQGSVEIVGVDRDLRDVLAELFQMMGVKYDLPPEVQGTVTTDLHHATYQQALAVLLGHKYEYTIGPHDVIYIHSQGTTWRPGGEKAA